MKKRKKNNKPLIILIVGLIISGSIIYYSINKIDDHKVFLKEHYENFEKNKEIEKNKCDEEIATIETAIETIESEIGTIEKEITSLQRQKTDEFMNSRGFSDRYYLLEDQITAKREEISKKQDDIYEKKSEITDLNSTIWEIENDFGDYRYSPPTNNFSPYIILALGIIAGIITLIVSGMSLLIKKVSGEKSYSEYNEIDEGGLSEIDVKDGKLLKKELFGKLELLLLASCKDDFDTIRELCTKNMAKSYIDEIELLKKHRQKLVIKDITNVSSKIVAVKKDTHNTTVTIVQKVKLYDYTKDINNDVINGNEKKKQTQAFKLVFIKDFAKDQSVKRCHNCGANVKKVNSVKCDYCGTIFDDGNYDWYLQSKVIISED